MDQERAHHRVERANAPRARRLVLQPQSDGAGAQPCQSDRDEPANRSFGRKAAGCSEGVEAVADEFFRGHVVPDAARCCGLGQQIPDEVTDLSLRTGDVLAAVQERRELGIAVPVGLMGDQRVAFQHRFEALADVARPIP